MSLDDAATPKCLQTKLKAGESKPEKVKAQQQQQPGTAVGGGLTH